MTDEPTNDKERALHHLGEAEKALREAMKQAEVWTAAYMQMDDTMDRCTMPRRRCVTGRTEPPTPRPPCTPAVGPGFAARRGQTLHSRLPRKVWLAHSSEHSEPPGAHVKLLVTAVKGSRDLQNEQT